MEFVLEEICHRGGSSAIGFLPGKVFHIVFLQGERLPYGIISAGTFSHLCGGRFTIEGKFYHMVLFPPLGKFCHWISSGGRFAIDIPSGGRLPYGIISGGGGGG